MNGTWPKGVPASVTPGGKFRVIAPSAEDEGIFGREGLLDETDFAPATLEAVLVPVEVLVGHVFGVEAYPAVADPAGVGEVLFVARYTARVLVGEDVSAARQTLFTGNADEMLGMKIFAQCLKIEKLMS